MRGEVLKRRLSVLCVFGTRPEAIKMAPLVLLLKREPDIRPIVVVTAQHREMLDQVLDIFSIRPDYDLDLMRPGQTLTQVTCGVLTGLEAIIAREDPDLVLVHGDTTTTMAAALASYYGRRPLGHVEAGLRTGDKYNPYPEEMNRRITSNLGDLHFSPTAAAKGNLLAEGVPEEKIYVTGNTVVDALRYIIEHHRSFSDPALERLVESTARLILLTAHRRESWGAGLREIFAAVRDLVRDFSDVQVVFPVHRNPVVRDQATAAFGGQERIHLIPPPAYNDFVRLMQRAYLVLTDSGGIQEEAPGLGVPVVVLRNTTERPEGLATGNAVLAGTRREGIYRLVADLLQDREKHRQMALAPNPYGDGKASVRIRDAIYHHFGRIADRPRDYVI